MDRRVRVRCAVAAITGSVWAFVLVACGGGGSAGFPVSNQPSGALSQPVTTISVPAAALTTRVAKLKYHVYAARSGTQAVAQANSRLHPSAINYPSDLIDFGGNVLARATSYDVYVDCASTCFGNPQEFLDDLNNSTYIHIADQYVGTSANGRYAYGGNIGVSVPLFTGYISEDELLAIAHSAAVKYGGGYGHIFHIFLPIGTDMCFD